MEKEKKFYERLGWALRSQRRIKKINIETIAGKLKVSSQQIQKYEKGENRIPVDKLSAYCDLLKIKSEWILEWSKGEELSL